MARMLDSALGEAFAPGARNLVVGVVHLSRDGSVPVWPMGKS